LCVTQPQFILSFEEDLLIFERVCIGKKGLFLLLELDKEWALFRLVLEGVLRLVKGTEVAEFITQQTNSLASLRALIIPILLQTVQKSAKEQIAQLLITSELMPSQLPRNSSEVIESLKRSLEEIFNKKSDFRVVGSEDLATARAKTDVTEEELALCICDWASRNVQLWSRVFDTSFRHLLLSTNSTPSGSRIIDIYHAAYPAKRITGLELSLLKGDLFQRVVLAEKNEWVKVTMAPKSTKVTTSSYMQPIFVEQLKADQSLQGVSPSVIEKAVAVMFGRFPIQQLLQKCIFDQELMYSMLHSIEDYNDSVVNLIDFSSLANRSTGPYVSFTHDIVYGIRLITSKKSSGMYMIVVKGSRLLKRLDLSMNESKNR